MNKALIKLLNNIYKINEQPIIIFGNQKSGTSAISHLIAQYGNLSRTIDIPTLWGEESKPIILGNIPFDRIVNQNKYYFSKDLIKEPMMTFYADQVVSYFDNGKFVYIIRDPRSNIKSILDRRKIPGNLKSLDPKFSNSAHLIGDSDLWNNVTEASTHYIDQLSNRWNDAIEMYYRVESRCLLVKYEAFKNNKLRTISQICNQFDISQKTDISSSLNKQYQPKGNHKLSVEQFFGYENLNRIVNICGNNMNRLGYKL